MRACVFGARFGELQPARNQADVGHLYPLVSFIYRLVSFGPTYTT